MSPPDEQQELSDLPPPQRPAGAPGHGQGQLDLPDVRQRRVLVGHPDSLAIRMIRLTLEGMRNIACDSSPGAERTFERAMQYHYDLFILAVRFENISGELLYSLIDKAYRLGEGDRIAAPAVLFIREETGALPPSLSGEPRVKGSLRWPFGMNELLDAVDRALPGTGVGRAIRPAP